MTQKYHKPIADSFVKYETTNDSSKETINGNHPSHCKDCDLNLVNVTDKQPKVQRDKWINVNTNNTTFPVCAYAHKHKSINKLISIISWSRMVC